MAIPLPHHRLYQCPLLTFPLPRAPGQSDERSLPHSRREVLGRGAARVKQDRHLEQSVEMGPSPGGPLGRKDLVDILFQHRHQHPQRRTAGLRDNYHLRPWFQQSQSELTHYAVWHRSNFWRLVLQLYRQPDQQKDLRCLRCAAAANSWHGARVRAPEVKRGWTTSRPVFHVLLLA